ncbi:hypothetical protein FKM82_005823 [Ascaphus truei]
MNLNPLLAAASRKVDSVLHVTAIALPRSHQSAILCLASQLAIPAFKVRHISRFDSRPQRFIVGVSCLTITKW